MHRVHSFLARHLSHGVLALGVVLASLALPLSGVSRAAPITTGSTAAACIPGSSTTPVFVFGQKGGNMRPFSITLTAGGAVTYWGVPRPLPAYHVRPGAVQGLERLAQAEGFATWPAFIRSKHLYPDVASLYITLRSGCSGAARTVTLQAGAVQPAFRELFDTLLAATAVQM